MDGGRSVSIDVDMSGSENVDGCESLIVQEAVEPTEGVGIKLW